MPTETIQAASTDSLTIYSSGYIMKDPTAVEVTLTGYPAVANAKFRITRSFRPAPKDVLSTEQQASTDTQSSTEFDDMPLPPIPLTRKAETKQQVFGYVSVPWLEDSYGDVMTPDSIEFAAHSFMHNLVTQNTEGKTGIGEEHWAFFDRSYPIQTLIDYDGNIGGIPYGWWLGTQIADPVVWQKVLSGNYAGYSLGSMTYFVNTASTTYRDKLFGTLPNLATLSADKPTTGKFAAFSFPGQFGYPSDASAYADPKNCKFPIDTTARVFATMQHVLAHYDTEGYSKEELKFMLGRMIQSLVNFGEAISEVTLSKVGLAKSTKSFWCNPFSRQAGREDSPTKQEQTSKEEQDMNKDDVVAIVRAEIQTTLDTFKTEQSAAFAQMQETVTTALQSVQEVLTQFSTKSTPTAPETPAPEVPAQQSAPQGAEQSNKGEICFGMTKDQFMDELTNVLAAKAASKETTTENKEQSNPTAEVLTKLQSEIDALKANTSGRQTGLHTVQHATGGLSPAELKAQRDAAPFDVEPTFF